jgi:hypothetical protein
MKSLNPLDTLSCEAFIRAILQLNEPLPDELHTIIRSTLQAIANQRPQSTDLIQAMLDQYPDFRAKYETTYRKLQTQYQRNEPSLADISRLAAQLFAADQPLTSVRQWVEPIQTAPTAKPEDFWEKGDRIMIMAAGGAFVGGCIAQIPGAIVGSLIAGTYGWYISFIKPRHRKA